jgi:hypothetical protein
VFPVEIHIIPFTPVLNAGALEIKGTRIIELGSEGEIGDLDDLLIHEVVHLYATALGFPSHRYLLSEFLADFLWFAVDGHQGYFGHGSASEVLRLRQFQEAEVTPMGRFITRAFGIQSSSNAVRDFTRPHRLSTAYFSGEGHAISAVMMSVMYELSLTLDAELMSHAFAVLLLKSPATFMRADFAEFFRVFLNAYFQLDPRWGERHEAVGRVLESRNIRILPSRHRLSYEVALGERSTVVIGVGTRRISNNSFDHLIEVRVGEKALASFSQIPSLGKTRIELGPGPCGSNQACFCGQAAKELNVVGYFLEKDQMILRTLPLTLISPEIKTDRCYTINFR